MKSEDIKNSVDKIKLTQVDEEILNGISERKDKKSSNKFNYKKN